MVFWLEFTALHDYFTHFEPIRQVVGIKKNHRRTWHSHMQPFEYSGLDVKIQYFETIFNSSQSLRASVNIHTSVNPSVHSRSKVHYRIRPNYHKVRLTYSNWLEV